MWTIVFFHRFKGSSVPVNSACFLCCKQGSDVCFSQAVLLLKLCYRRKFGNTEIAERDEGHVLVLPSARVPAGTVLRKEPLLSYRSLSRFFTWISPFAAWILGHELCIFLVLVDNPTFKTHSFWSSLGVLFLLIFCYFLVAALLTCCVEKKKNQRSFRQLIFCGSFDPVIILGCQDGGPQMFVFLWVSPTAGRINPCLRCAVVRALTSCLHSSPSFK